MQDSTRKLWGQNFRIVPGGLSPDEVIRFVNGLLARYQALAEQQQHLVSLETLAEKAALEARKVASDIRARATREAEEEALRLTSAAAEKAREIVVEGRRAAQDARLREGDSIMKSAHAKAAMMEAEARQRAQLFLIRSREVIEDRLHREVNQVYACLLTSLQELLLEGKDCEMRWKDKALDLWKADLPDFAAGPAAFETADWPPSEEFMFPKPEEPDGPEVIAAPVPAPEPLPGQDSGASSSASATDAGPLMPEAPPVLEEAQSGELPAAIAVVAAPEALPTDSQATPAPAMEDVSQHEADAHEAMPVSQAASSEANPTAQRPGISPEGEVDLVLVPPIALPLLSALHSCLQSIDELRILRTVGSWNRGTTITVLIEKPLPLAAKLSKIPGLAITHMPDAPADGETHAKAAGPFGVRKPGRHRITLKAA